MRTRLRRRIQGAQFKITQKRIIIFKKKEEKKTENDNETHTPHLPDALSLVVGVLEVGLVAHGAGHVDHAADVHRHALLDRRDAYRDRDWRQIPAAQRRRQYKYRKKSDADPLNFLQLQQQEEEEQEEEQQTYSSCNGEISSVDGAISTWMSFKLFSNAKASCSL
jgi:hypothetical protein